MKNTNIILTFLIFLGLQYSSFANIDHSSWDELLNQNVSENGRVNYEGFIKNIDDLNEYLESLRRVNPVELERDEELAFWMNAYNAFTIKLIVDNYPVSSIIDLDGGKVWDRKWININGQKYSLNNIENDIIRPRFKDARIHFAVNCAAKSCPPLHNEAFTASNVNDKLEVLTRKFINNDRFNDISGGVLKVSKIFEWYSTDFGPIVEYLRKYSDKEIANAKVEFKNYDWNLNE